MRGAILLLPFVAWALVGQPPPATWDNVKTISPGTEIRAERTGLPTIRGQVISVTDDSIVVKAGKKSQTLTRQQVDSVSVHKNGHRARNAAIGAGIGAVGGMGTGLAITRCTGFCLSDVRPAVTAGMSVAGAVIGAVIGAIIPTGGWLPVYKR